MKSPFITLSAVAVTLLLVGWLDYVTGPELGFFVFYFLPVSIAAWYSGRRLAVLSSLVATLVWFFVQGANGLVYSSGLIKYWNGAVRFVAFLIIGLTVSRSRRSRLSRRSIRLARR